MKTTDLFKFNRSAQRLNESMEKMFGKKINLEAFNLDELQDARNKLRTQVSQVRSESGFNENLENEAFSKAQFMLDAINAEIAEREEFTIEATELEEKAPPGAKAERMVKHIKKGYAKDGKLTDKEKSIAYATAWKQHNKNESIDTTGDDMRNLKEGEIQQAQSIVSAKTMVDRVGRWIEELSGMENDTLLQLGDQIRDEMGQEQAKAFLTAVAPAIQQALENLKQTRETLATGVRTLTGEEQGAEMLGAEPSTDMGDEGDMGDMGDMGGEAPPDEMNAGGDMGASVDDAFAAAEPGAGGLETAGREKRESIDFSNKLLKVLAG
jgi:hypothetical protein